MEIVFHRVETAQLRGPQPSIGFRRSGPVWWVPNPPLCPGQPLKWTSVRKGDVVMVPLTSYDLAPEAGQVAAFFTALGAWVLEGLPAGVRPQTVSVVYGSPFEESESGGQAYWRIWIGAAVQGS